MITEDFLLKSDTAKELYASVKDLPIIDYHCHLSPKMIAEDYRFRDACDLFLGGDHYKWRQLRSFGIDEKYITGDADGREKWLRFAKAYPYMIGNPIYHWTALELKRYFGVDEPLSEDTAEKIWEKCGSLLASEGYGARGLILRSNVEVICTTDDPADSLEYHKALLESGFPVKVLPTFRPDRLLSIEKPDFIDYVKAASLDGLESVAAWIDEKTAFFHQNGCRLSDQALGYVPYAVGDADAALKKRLAGETLTREETDVYKTAVLSLLAKRYAELGWAMQIHIGALRNNNTEMFGRLGADTGFDSINDREVAENLSAFLDSLDKIDRLPKTILYNLNPKDNYVLASMIGNFQKGPQKGKLQFGSGWWFNDNISGMTAQLEALANLGVLGTFVGMLTDSRSFVSYTRHEYFRRIFCNLLGSWVEDGLYPRDMARLKEIAADVCYRNAKSYFGF